MRTTQLEDGSEVVVNSKRKEEFRIHLGLVLAELFCVPAFFFEMSRAAAGNQLSWAYVFEWPLLGSYAVYMWRRMLHDLRDEREGMVAPVLEETSDPDLDAWNEYLAQRRASD